MRQAISESDRRRAVQIEYNRKNKITPRSIEKAIREGIEVYINEEEKLLSRLDISEGELEIYEAIDELEKEMSIAAKNLQFEKAAQIRDRIKELKEALKK
jgi:excinuclease ABC subunit B